MHTLTKEKRRQMNKRYIGFSASNKIYGRLIRWLTGSKINHAFILCDNLQDDFGIQVDGKGVRYVNPLSLTKDKPFVELYEYTEDEYAVDQGIRDNCFYIGSKYDWWGIIGFLIKILFMKVCRQDISNPIHREGELFCSEYVATVLNSAEVTFDGESLSPANTSPGLLRRKIRKELGKTWRELTPEEYEKFGVKK